VTFDVRRVVTDRTTDGTSVFAEVPVAEPQTVLGLEIHNLWGTDDGTPVVGAGQDPSPVPFPFFPGSGGTRFIVVRFPPESAAPADGDPAEALADAERRQPGLTGVFEPDVPGMHTTDTVDYGVCVDGEIYLELDDGAEVHVTPGTCVVQRGTRHAWHNRGDRPCTMVYVLAGAERK
jgi:Cupin domain